jgi:GYF domain 2
VEYFVKRGEQRFGPYNLSDLQTYVQSGDVLTDDLTQSEGMADWVPVSQVLGNIPVTVINPASSLTQAATQPQFVPLPPNLHWSIVLILGIFTLQLFNMVWAMVQANWARKLSNNNKPMVLVAMYPAGITAIYLTAALFPGMLPFAALIRLAVAIVYLVGIFSIKDAMEDYYNSTENNYLQMSGVMTFFFSTVYIQYQINSIARWKKTGSL